jgi:sugar phosphate isomerase/epimerase
MTPIALQLYSVRQDAADDFEATLREVAAIGYDGVEVFDLHGHDVTAVAGWLSELGLAVTSRHARLEAIEDDLAVLAAEARELGCKRLVISWVDPAQLDTAMLARIAVAASAAAAQGFELGYHNHDAEVEQGFLDRLPSTVFLELDAGWTWWAGEDPVAFLGRGPLVHVKDFRDRETRSYCPVGDGAVDYEHMLPAAVEAGVEWLIVEQDEPVESELADARRSLSAVVTMLGEVA